MYAVYKTEGTKIKRVVTLLVFATIASTCWFVYGKELYRTIDAVNLESGEVVRYKCFKWGN